VESLAANLNTRRAIEEEIELLLREAQAANQAAAAVGRVPTGTRGVMAPAEYERTFDKQLERSIARYRPRAAEAPMSPRGARMGVHGLEMLMEGRISPRSLAHGAGFIAEGAQGLGLGRVAAGAGAIAGLASSAIGIAGLGAVGYGIVEELWLKSLRERDEKAKKALEATQAAFVATHGGELRGTVDVDEWMRRQRINRFSVERAREIRRMGEAEQERVRAEQLGFAGTDRMINELMKGRHERDPFIKRQIAEEAAAALLNSEKYALEHQREFRRRLQDRKPGAWEQGLGPGRDVPLTKAAMIEWMEQNALGEGMTARHRQIARQAALEVFQGIAKELRAESERAFLAREERERAGERLTGGVRNAVLWTQDRAKLKAMEEMALEKYMEWSPQ